MKKGKDSKGNVVVDGVIYETQALHDWRIAGENARFKRGKKKSRSRAAYAPLRARIISWANGKCQICAYGYTEILTVHHIVPVHLGGTAKASNLVAICPNCHAHIHRFAKRKGDQEKRITFLESRGRLNREQALRLLLVASMDAWVNGDNEIAPHDNSVKDRLCVIVDAPNANPEHYALFWDVMREHERKQLVKFQDSHIERGRRACQQP